MIITSHPSSPLASQDAAARPVDPNQSTTQYRAEVSQRVAVGEISQDEADTYIRPRVVSHIFSTAWSPAEGEAVSAMSRITNEAMHQYSAGASFNTSGFLNNLGALSADTSAYTASQLRMDVSEQAVESGYRPELGGPLAKVHDSVEMTVRTADGDVVTLTLERGVDSEGKQGLSVAFNVEGDLSEAEQKELDTLSQSLGKIADNFFAEGKANLSELNGLSTSQLTGFELSLLAGDETLSLTYDVNNTQGERRLQGEYQGYTFDITQAMEGRVSGEPLTENAQYQQYMQLIEQAGRDYDSDNDVIGFMKAGMDVLFAPAEDAEADDTGPVDRVERVLGQSNEALLDQFNSNLPDFKASFHSPVTVNPFYVADKAFMSLEMSQVSAEEKKEDGHVFAAQRFNYEQTIQTFEPLNKGEEPELAEGNYILKTIERREQTDRTLVAKAGTPKEAFEHRQGEEVIKEQIKLDFTVVDEKEDRDSFNEIIDLIAEASESGPEVFQKKLDDLIDSETLDIFNFT